MNTSKYTCIYTDFDNNESQYIDITNYKFNRKIYDLTIMCVNNYEEAREYIDEHENDKAVLFYKSNNISPDEQQELQSVSHLIQLYSIVNNFSERNFEDISRFLYSMHHIVQATLLYINKLENFTDGDICHLLDTISKMKEVNKYIRPEILIRCEESIKEIIS